jgi:hypothetical protein
MSSIVSAAVRSLYGLEIVVNIPHLTPYGISKDNGRAEDLLLPAFIPWMLSDAESAESDDRSADLPWTIEELLSLLRLKLLLILLVNLLLERLRR